jgi:hypothetical protein
MRAVFIAADCGGPVCAQFLLLQIVAGQYARSFRCHKLWRPKYARILAEFASEYSGDA